MNNLKKKRFVSLLMRFRPEEMPDIIDDIFNGFTWDSVKAASFNLGWNLCKMRELADICLYLFTNQKPSVEDVQIAYWRLQFFDCLLHKYIKWNGAVLTNKEDSFPEDLEQLQDKIMRAYRMEARRVEIIAKLEDNIVFVMLIERIITKRGMKNGKPFFAAFAVDLEKIHVFYSPKGNENSSDPDHLQLLSQALGFSTFKDINFTGYDVRSLFTMLKNHHNYQFRPLTVFKPIKIREEGKVIDFTQGIDRIAYADQILPRKLSTNIKEFTVSSNVEFRGSLPIPSEERMCTQIKIKVKAPRGYSIEDVFRDLIIRNLIQVPVPEYVDRFPALNKNTVKLRKGIQESNRTEDVTTRTSWDDDTF